MTEYRVHWMHCPLNYVPSARHEIDQVNGPARSLVGGEVQRRWAQRSTGSNHDDEGDGGHDDDDERMCFCIW